jgi:hypothetical protein
MLRPGLLRSSSPFPVKENGTRGYSHLSGPVRLSAQQIRRKALGQQGFDRLRNYDGDGKLSVSEKHRGDIHPGGLDIDNHLFEYEASGNRYNTIQPKPDPVRWDREFVLSRVLEKISSR